MSTTRLTVVTILFLNLPVFLAGQDETQPASPVLDMVTVDPSTGFSTLTWIPSVSPDVGSYVIYTYSGSTATAVDTVKTPFVSEYTHTGSAARYHTVTYVVAAMDSSLNISPLSNSLSTIFLSAVNDTCNSRILLTWAPYENSSHPAENYRLMVAEGGGPSVTYETLGSSVSSYTFDGYAPDTEYCFNIIAYVNTESLSSSNRVCATSASQTPPGWVMVDAIMVDGGAMTLAGSYDPATDIDDFHAVKYSPVTSSWSVAANAKGSGGIVTFDLPPADTAVINLYAITAVNSCSVPVTTSSPARNIVLTSTVTGTRIDLRWNKPLPTGEVLFSIWREKGDGWDEVGVNLSDTLWSDDYSLLTSGFTAPALAYTVTASVPALPAEMPLHRSSVVEVEVSQNIFVPNAFTPDVPGPNELFKPEISFIPQEYELMIFNRSGVMLFRTTDYGEGWDGRHNGIFLPPGVYLWSLRLKTLSGVTEVRRGTVTILP
ncbi:MAG: gliding motility-associated C-terminal domain-containing protein [Bacteroidales bacterium]|jgi:gliding motility-associated-like protein|nr:gliding motility-associated C-terminal domain-containing protein [Bacteroidales bacterium]